MSSLADFSHGQLSEDGPGLRLGGMKRTRTRSVRELNQLLANAREELACIEKTLEKAYLTPTLGTIDSIKWITLARANIAARDCLRDRARLLDFELSYLGAELEDSIAWEATQ